MIFIQRKQNIIKKMKMNKLGVFLKKSWKFSINYYILLIFGIILSLIQMYVVLYFPALLVEKITSEDKISGVAIVGIFALINFLFCLTFNYLEYRTEIEKKYVSEMMNLKLSEKIMNVPYYKIEDPYYLELRQKAIYSIEVQDSIANLLYALSNILKKLFIITELIYIVYSLSYIFMVFIIAVNMIIGFAYYIYKKNEKILLEKLITINRKFSYYLGLCFDDKLQKDIRIYNMSDMLTNKVRGQNKKVLNHQRKYHRNVGIYSGMVSALYVIQNAFAYIYIIFRTFIDKSRRRLSYGELTFYISAITNLFINSRDIISDVINCKLWINYLSPILEFFSISEEQEKNIVREKIESIEFRNVSFMYPGTKEPAINNISFKIRGNQRISIVGQNGAGKTTLIKLLCKLYKPTSGEILINGKNIWNNDYMNNISTVFQDYKMFAVTITENITSDNDIDIDKIHSCMEQLKISYLDRKYKNGIFSELNKAYEDEGIDLSGGEKQKIALARSLYKEGEIFILDEPTSALDPKAEAQIFEDFDRMTKGKMCIFISHRMSSSHLCKSIIVMHEGRIIDQGTHNDLMKKKSGIYYQLYKAQADNYK